MSDQPWYANLINNTGSAPQPQEPQPSNPQPYQPSQSSGPQSDYVNVVTANSPTPQQISRDIWNDPAFHQTLKDAGASVYDDGNDNYSVVPKDSSYWESPSRIVRWNDVIRTAEPDWTPPPFVDKEAIQTAYQYMSYKNNGEPWQNWKPLDTQDPMLAQLRQMKAPPDQYLWPDEQKYAQQTQQVPLSDAELAAGKQVDFNSLHNWQQYVSGGLAPNPQDIKQDNFHKFVIPSLIKNGLPAYGMGKEVAMLGTIASAPFAGLAAPIVGTAAGLGVGGAVLAGGMIQDLTGQKVPFYDQAMNGMMLATTTLEKIIGVGAQGAKPLIQAAGNVIEGKPVSKTLFIDEANNAADVINHIGDAWAAASGNTYANMPDPYPELDPLNLLAILNDPNKPDIIGAAGNVVDALTSITPAKIIGNAGNANNPLDVADISKIKDAVVNLLNVGKKSVDYQDKIGAMGVRKLFGTETPTFGQVWDLLTNQQPGETPAQKIIGLLYNPNTPKIISAVINPSDVPIADATHAWKFEQGYTEPQPIEGPTGLDALEATRKAIIQMKAEHPELTDNQVQQAVAALNQKRLGISGIEKEFMGQIMLDPNSLVGRVQSETGEMLANKVGNKRLAEAFHNNIGSAKMDVQAPIVRDFAGMGTGEHASGGVFQGIEGYKDMLRSNYTPAGEKITAAQDFSKIEKFVGGLNEQGGFKELDKTPGGVIGYLTNMTPESKATFYGLTFTNNLGTMIETAKDLGEVRTLLDKAAGNLPVNEGDLMEQSLKSPEFVTVRDGLKVSLEKAQVNDLLAKWDMSEKPRQLLDKVSIALGIEPNEVLKMLEDPKRLETLTKMLNDSAPTAGTPDMLKNRLGMFIGENRIPWSEEEYKAKINAAIMDKMNQYLIDKYDVKPKGKVLQFFNILKSVQSLALLKFNPSYFLNNKMTNDSSRMASGAWGYSTVGEMKQFLNDFGITPANMNLQADQTEVMGVGAKYPTAINDALRDRGVMGSIQQGLKAFNKLPGFDKVSGMEENRSGDQTQVMGIKRFMDSNARVGQGIRELPPALATILDQQAPGLKELIYSGINAGLSADKLQEMITQGFVQPHIDMVLDKVADGFAPGNPEPIRQFIKETGIQDALKKELETAKTPAQVDRAFSNVEEHTQDMIDQKHFENLQHVAEDARNKVQAERFPAVLQAHGDIEVEKASRWISSRREWDELYSKKDLYQPGEWQAQVRALDAKQERDWQRLNQFETQTYAGVIQALGVDNEYTRGYVKLIGEVQDEWRTFFSDKRRLMDELYSRTIQKDGETKKDYFNRRDMERNVLQDKLDKAYEDHYTAERGKQMQMDALFSKAYADFTGWDPTKAEQWRKGLLDKRYEMYAEQKQQRALTRNMNQAEKDLAYAPFNVKYNGMIQEMKAMEHRGAHEILYKPEPQVYMGDMASEQQPTPKKTTNVRPGAGDFTQSDFEKARDHQGQPLPMAGAENIPPYKAPDIQVPPERKPVTPDITPEQINQAADNLAQKKEKPEMPYEAQVPTMITRDMKQQLADLGYTSADVKGMTPQEAWDNINAGMKPVDSHMPDIVKQYTDAGVANPHPNHIINIINQMRTEEGKPAITTADPTFQSEADRGLAYYKANHMPSQVADTIKTKLTADRIVGMADAQKREAAIRAEGMMTRKQFESKMREVRTDAPEAEHIANMFLMDKLTDQWARNQGMAPTDATRDAWYATHIKDLLAGNEATDIPASAGGSMNVSGALNDKPPLSPSGDGSSVSNGTPKDNTLFQERLNNLVRQQRTINTPEFRNWFGDSKVTDDNGQPLIVYHGTDANFTEFDTNKVGKNFGDTRGIFFTNDPGEASNVTLSYDTTPQSGENVKPVYVKLDNPLVYEYNKKTPGLSQAVYSTDVFDQLKSRLWQEVDANGNDGIIVRNTDTGLQTVVATSPEQIKSATGNRGTFDPTDPNILRQTTKEYNRGVLRELATSLAKEGKITLADEVGKILDASKYGNLNDAINNSFHSAEIIKRLTGNDTLARGGVTFQEDGRAIVHGLAASDASTLMHEVAHIFRRDLSEADLEAVAKHGGLRDANHLRELQEKFDNGTITPEEEKLYRNAEEYFSKGWEQYLSDGSAPTPEMRSVFQKFSTWLRDIYKRLTGGDPSSYFQQDGRPVDINVKIDGVSLRDIFDRQITDAPNRAVTFDDILGERQNNIRNEGANYRFSQPELNRLAVKDSIARVLAPFENVESARAYTHGTQDYQYTANGRPIDPTAVHDAIVRMSLDPTLSPWQKVDSAVRGTRTIARGIANNQNKYEFTWKVIPMEDLTASHVWKGNSLEPNANYPQELQPRLREQAASVLQVNDIASKLNPDDLIYDSRALDRGAPVVGPDNMVESGNGRSLAMMRAAEMYPEKWQAYQDSLKESLPVYGIDPKDIEGMKNPVLVRERTTEVSRAAFANDANKPIALQMNPMEIALNDSKNISNETLKNLVVSDNETIDGALQAAKNDWFVKKFMETLSETERGNLSDNGKVNRQGLERLTYAIFSKVYPGEAGDRLLRTFSMSTDSDIKTAEKAVMASLPQLAKTEGLIKEGMRAAELSIAPDIAIAVDKLSSLRQSGSSVKEYFAQDNLFGKTLTPLQETILELMGGRQQKLLSDFIRSYADLVDKEPDPRQTGFDFIGATDNTGRKEQLANAALNTAKQQPAGTAGPQPDLFAAAAGEQPAAAAEPTGAIATAATQAVDRTAPSLAGNELAGSVTGGRRNDRISAKDSRDTQTVEDFTSGRPVPIEQTRGLELKPAPAITEPESVATLRQKAETYRSPEAKQTARDYVQWVIDGEKGNPPGESNPILSKTIVQDYANSLEVLREYAAQKSRGEPVVSNDTTQPGITVEQVHAFDHGDTPIAANVYKDGDLVAYMPAGTDTAKTVELEGEKAQVLGLSPEDPTKWVYEVNGEIRTIDPKTPSEDAPTLFQPKPKTKVQAGQIDMFSQGASDLPLFSGVPMDATQQTFNPQAESGQLSMFPDLVPQEAPRKIIELAIKDQGFTSYTRMDMANLKKVKQTLDMHPDSAITYRVLDARGKVLSSGTDAREVISPTLGKGKPGTLFEETPTPKPIDRPETALPEDWAAYIKELEAKTAKLGVDSKLNIKLYGGTQFDKAVDAAPHKIYFDVAGLKAVNDQYGHAAGDQLLHAVVKVSDALGADLHRANSAGDEFVVPLNSEAEAAKFKEALRKKLNEQIIIFAGKDGQQHAATGLDAHIGSGTTVSAADIAAHSDTIPGYKRGGLPPTWRESILSGSDSATATPGAAVSGLQYTESYSGDRTGRPGVSNLTGEAAGSGNNAREILNQTRKSLEGVKEDANYIWKNTKAAIGNPLNSTPTLAPDAQAVQELNIDTARPMLKRMQEEYTRQMTGQPKALPGAAPETIDALNQYMKDIRSDVAATKMTAMRYGQSLRDYAMLNYSQRYGIDDVLNTIFPYQFWYTRSMMNWGRRAIDAPQWLSMYANLQSVQDKLQHAGMPTRLAGKARLPMPWMQAWTGGGLWVDPYKNLFPFGQFLDPWEKQAQQQSQIDRQAEHDLDAMVTDGTITTAQRQDAVNTHQGDLWTKAQKQAGAELDISNTPMDMVSMMMTPALWWTIPEAIINKHPETISPLPITKFGQTIRTLGKDTFAQPATDLVGGAMAWPEETVRKNAGLSPYGQFGEYYVDRALANMAAEPNSQFSTDDIQRAMIERSGPIYDEAIKRIDNELALRTPGAAAIMALKQNAGVGNVLGAAAAMPLGGGGLYPQGEQIQRDNKAVYNNAWAKYDAGDKSALTDFFNEYPSYTLRNAMNDTPEGRLRNFLIEQDFTLYNGLDRADKAKAREVMGDNWNSMYDKTLRQGLDIKQLATWGQTLGAKAPKTPLLANMPPVQTPNYMPTAESQAVSAFQNERDQKFPMYYPLQSEYYNLPTGAPRKEYLKQFPQLKQYWDWKAQQATDHPELQTYFDELKTAQSQAQLEPAMNEVTTPLLRQLMDYSAGGTLTTGASAEMRRIWQQYGNGMSYQEYLDLITKTLYAGSKSTAQ